MEGGGGERVTVPERTNGTAARLHVPAAEMRLQNGADVRANERTQPAQWTTMQQMSKQTIL